MFPKRKQECLGICVQREREREGVGEVVSKVIKL